MNATVSSPIERRALRTALVLATLALAVALVSLAGWAFGVPRLRQLAETLPPVNPVTAALLALGAVALGLRALGPETPRRRGAAMALAFVVVEAAALRLQELVSGWNAGLDQTLLPVPVVNASLRMEPLTAAALVFAGLALLITDRGPARGWWPGQLAAALASAIAGLALAAQAFGESIAGREAFRLMNPQAAAAAALIGLGALALRPHGDLMRATVEPGPAGRAFRRSFAVAVPAALLAGWAGVSGLHAGHFGAAMAIAVASVVGLAVFAALLWQVTNERASNIAAVEAAPEPESPELEDLRRRLGEAEAAAQRATQESEALRVRERDLGEEPREAFLSHVSTAMRAPLEALLQSIEPLRGGGSGPLAPEAAERIESAVHHAETLGARIDDLLDTVRAGNGKLELATRRVAVGPLVAAALDTQRAHAGHAGVSLTLDPVFTAQDVEADPDRMVQILRHLVDNAIRFTPAGGSVRVAVSLTGDLPPRVMVSVIDNGRGIAPGERDQVFEGFKTTAPESGDAGLGLGLSICRQLAGLMEGCVWFESVPDQGSSFHLELPVWSRRPALTRLAPRCVEGEPLARVSVDFARADGLPLDAGNEPALLEAHRVAATCVLPDKDVLLPREGPADGGERFHLLARAHEDGAEVLRARLEGELGACAALREAGIRFRVTTAVLPAYETLPEMDPADFLEGLITSSLAEDLLAGERRDEAA